MNNTLKKMIGALLAVIIAVSCGMWASDAHLKATDEGEVPEQPVQEQPAATQEVVVEQNNDYVVAELVDEPAAPAEEPAAEEPTGDSTEAPSEPAGEEPFDVVKAYEHYISLSDSEKEAYLLTLTEEQRTALIKYIELMEQAAAEKAEASNAESEQPAEAEPQQTVEAEPQQTVEAEPQQAAEAEPASEAPVIAEQAAEPEAAASEEAQESVQEEAPVQQEKKIELWYSYDGELKMGTSITICSALSGYSGNLTYQWVYSEDGVNWKTIPGANGQTFTFTLNKTNNWFYWDLWVTEG